VSQPPLVTNSSTPNIPPISTNPAENKIPNPDFLQHQMTAARAGRLLFSWILSNLLGANLAHFFLNNIKLAPISSYQVLIAKDVRNLF